MDGRGLIVLSCDTFILLDAKLSARHGVGYMQTHKALFANPIGVKTLRMSPF